MGTGTVDGIHARRHVEGLPLSRLEPGRLTRLEPGRGMYPVPRGKLPGKNGGNGCGGSDIRRKGNHPRHGKPRRQSLETRDSRSRQGGNHRARHGVPLQGRDTAAPGKWNLACRQFPGKEEKIIKCVLFKTGSHLGTTSAAGHFSKQP